MPPSFDDTTPLPDPELVLELWDRFGMLDNIRQHSRVVCDVALTLADWLDEAGIHLMPRAVEAGALLHDIAKTHCLGTPTKHDQEGERWLVDLGYPELAYLVGVHVRLPDPHPIDESFLVYYADKRVRHDEIVDLDRRFAYIEQRYGNGDKTLLALIARGRERAKRAEAQLFGALALGRTPEGLAHASRR